MFMFSALFFLEIMSLGAQASSNTSNRGIGHVDRILLSGHAYPISALGEVHSSFTVQFPITPEFETKLEGFYDTFMYSSRFRTDLVLKGFFADRFYAFAGLQTERTAGRLDESVSRNDWEKPRNAFLFGTGYQVEENFFLEARANHQYNNSQMGSFREPFVPVPQVYMLRGKLKF